ncbi:MAG: lactate utilization protein C [Congregibacter sp.]
MSETEKKSDSEREREVLTRIFRASERADAETISAELNSLQPSPLAEASRESLLESFVANLRRNGCSCDICDDRSAAVAQISEFVAARHGQRRVVTGYDPRLAALPWRDAGLLPRFGTAQTGDAVAVTYAHLAIAETGSMAIMLNRNNPASNNLLPEDHVILVNQSDLRYSLENLWQEPSLQSSDTRPRGIMLISGPSSTADIGMQLVHGAHGPKALHVVVLTDDNDGHAAKDAGLRPDPGQH